MARLSHERRVALAALAAGTPAVAVALYYLWGPQHPDAKVQVTLTLAVLVCWLGAAVSLAERVASPLRTLANLLEALREGDYSVRGRHTPGALGDVQLQVNEMAATLNKQRLGALEATALLRKVMEEIDVAVFAFDGAHKLRLANRAAERLLSQPVERMLGAQAAALDLGEFLDGEATRTVQRAFPGAAGRWGVARSTFREGGLPHQLLVITDLTRPLREEELQAWQRLVRVLGHELNNSLTPIKSIASSLGALVGREPRPEDWEADMQRGLTVIASRSEALSRFTAGYARLAKLPRPKLGRVEVRKLVEQAARLETRLRVAVRGGPEIAIQADSDQIEQLLINLLRNAVDAALETGGGVEVGWTRTGGQVEILISDQGPGISNPANLFVPFFTTKPGGSGIGLVLCRQIAEAHGGSLSLQNRSGIPGVEARLSLPT